MTRSCRFCKQAFEITDGDLAFYDKVSPVFAGKKESIPPPTLCPPCRERRRMAWKNERKWNNGTCGKCSKPFSTTYAPERPETVYCEECYLGEVY